MRTQSRQDMLRYLALELLRAAAKTQDQFGCTDEVQNVRQLGNDMAIEAANIGQQIALPEAEA